MWWQKEFIRTADPITANTPYKLDLPKSGMLGSILLKITGTQIANLGQAGGAWRLIDFISKITVLAEASTVVKSLTGYQLQALAFYDQGVIPPSLWRNVGTNTQTEYLLINFGRYMYDTEMGIDLAKYNNVQLQIENIIAAAQFSAISVNVMAFYLREASAGQFGGYIRSEEWRSWVTVRNQWVYNDLPTEGILRRITLQCIPGEDANFQELTSMVNLADDVALGLDTGQIRVWRGSIEDLIRENHLYNGRNVFVGGLAQMTATKGFRTSLGVKLAGAWGSGATGGAVSTIIPTLDTTINGSNENPISAEAAHPISFLDMGLAPFLTAQFCFDQDYNPSTWMNTNARKVVKLDVHSADIANAAGGRNAIVLERLFT